MTKAGIQVRRGRGRKIEGEGEVNEREKGRRLVKAVNWPE
jgi:hypothetical protein